MSDPWHLINTVLGLAALGLGLKLYREHTVLRVKIKPLWQWWKKNRLKRQCK
jgi:hypothetical protein